MRLLRIAPLLVALAACTSAPASPSIPSATRSATPTTAPTTAPTAKAETLGGCGATPILRGGTLPAWTASGMSTFQGDPGPYVMSTEGDVVGILFGYPFHAGPPQTNGPSPKVLWIMREPRNGATLKVDGHPLGATTPVGHAEQTADSSPGEIYPSIVELPVPGCWHLTLTWNGNTATVDLPYGPAA